MANKYPIQLNNLRFYVNPQSLSINKSLNYGTLVTQGGYTYQIWYDNPEILTISGVSAGSTAYKELLFLKSTYELTNKVSELFYKTRIYKGFITSLVVSSSIDKLNEFSYTIAFQLLHGESFKIEDFSLAKSATIGGTLGKIETVINENIAAAVANISRTLKIN